MTDLTEAQRTLLAARVAEPDLAGLSESEVVAALNAPDPTFPLKRVDVETAEAKNILRMSGELGAVVLLSRQTPDMADPAQASLMQAVAVAIVVEDTLRTTTTLGTTRDDHWGAMQFMVGALQQAGVVSQTSAEALLGLAWGPQSWAEAQGLPPVTARDVGLARGGI